MKTFVVFDRKTGEILRTHVQTGGHGAHSENLLKALAPVEQLQSVDILAVDEIAPGTGYKVDTKQKKLVPTDAKKAPGIGGAFVQSSGSIPPATQTVFFNAREKSKK